MKSWLQELEYCWRTMENEEMAQKQTETGLKTHENEFECKDKEKQKQGVKSEM